MDIFDAAYRVAHDFPERGAVGLALKIGKNPGTFLNEVSGTVETAKLGLATAVAMSVAADDPRILHAFADAMGFVAIKRPSPHDDASDQALLDLFLSRDIRAGSFAKAVASAIEDGHISRDEMADIQERAYQAAQAIFDIRSRLAGLVDG
jgi:hypothetical protein